MNKNKYQIYYRSNCIITECFVRACDIQDAIKRFYLLKGVHRIVRIEEVRDEKK